MFHDTPMCGAHVHRYIQRQHANPCTEQYSTTYRIVERAVVAAFRQ